MTTAVKIINLGLTKIAASKRVSSIEPPRSNLEKEMAENYPHWRDTELTRNRWYFSTEYVQLTQDASWTPGNNDTEQARPYRYKVPNDGLRALREKDTDWVQRGTYLYSAIQSAITVLFILRKSEAEFDPLFIEVLACRVALDANELVTQSNTKFENRERWYKDALDEAARASAMVRGPVDLVGPDSKPESYEWTSARWVG